MTDNVWTAMTRLTQLRLSRGAGLFFFFCCMLACVLPLHAHAQNTGCTNAPIGGSLLRTLGSATVGDNPMAAQMQTAAAVQATICQPVPRIKIPGLEFTSAARLAQNMYTDPEDGATYLFVPFLGEYISAVYRYGIALAGVVIVMMLIASGIQWTLGGVNPDSIDAAKERIKNALIGLCILSGTYTVLYTINPELTSFKSLKIQLIPPREGRTLISAADYQQITGHAPLPKGDIVRIAVAAGQSAGLADPCYMPVIVSKESSGNPRAIGHDENYRGDSAVGARKNFLISGIKKSGTRFNATTEAGYSYEEHNEQDVVNDDTFQPGSPPDYGLDWRFSHGFGLGQITLGGDSYCDHETGTRVRGREMGGTCFSIADLLDEQKNLTFTALLFGENLACAGTMGLTGRDQIIGAFYSYAGGCGGLNSIGFEEAKTRGATVTAMEHYDECARDPDIYITTLSGS